MSVAQRSTLRQRLFAFLIAGIGGAIAAAVSFGISLYDAANPETVPVVAAGQPIDTGRWIVTVHDAWTGNIPPTGTRPVDPKTFLMVDLDVNNRSAATSNSFAGLLAIDPAIPGLPDPTFYLARDKWIAGSLHPDMPERLIAVWEWPEDRPVPRELRLTIGSQIYKRRDNLYGAPGWFDREPAAAVSLPVSAAAPS